MTSLKLEERLPVRPKATGDWTDESDEVAPDEEARTATTPEEVSQAHRHAVRDIRMDDHASTDSRPLIGQGLSLTGPQHKGHEVLSLDRRAHEHVVGLMSEWRSSSPLILDASSRLIRDSREILGSRITAYLSGLRSDELLDAWASALAVPPDPIRNRLRIASHAARIVAEWDGVPAARAWLAGQNRRLGDTAPIRLLYENPTESAGPEIIAAARAFVAGT
jgi:hypothetical protein